MKSLVVVLLAVLLAANSLTAASDTLRVISYRSIDVCSGDRSWLIAFSIGEVFASDSLQSFDITVGFDTSRVTPTDLLISGTLADQMRFGELSPFMRTAVPGELRVGGFTVTRNVRGDLPLVAVSGSYKGECGDADTFSLAYNPNSGFNEEYKGEITSFVSDSIVAIAIPRNDPSQGVSFDVDTLQLAGLDSTGITNVSLYQNELVGSTVVDHISITDDQLFRIDTLWVASSDSIVYDPSGQQAWVFRQINSEEFGDYRISVVSTTTARDTMTTMSISTSVLSECGCVTPTRSGELYLRSQHTTTSVEQRDVHESTDLIIRPRAEALELQCSHGQPWKVTVVDVTGRQVASTQVTPGTTFRLSLSPLPSGLYIVYATDGRTTQGMTIAK